MFLHFVKLFFALIYGKPNLTEFHTINFVTALILSNGLDVLLIHDIYQQIIYIVNILARIEKNIIIITIISLFRAKLHKIQHIV